MRICQLQKIFLSIFLLTSILGCSHSKLVVNHDEGPIVASWLKLPLKFSFRDQNDNYLTHPFFDADPDYKKDPRTINYFVTTPKESSYKYNFDLYSGALYKDRDYCQTDDIWDSYKEELYKPNFSEGLVPRMEAGDLNPQRIVIFSDPLKIEKFKPLPTHFNKARIVGSVVLETCENYPCDSKDKWTSAQILVGVNIHDDYFKKTNLLNELKSKVDWPYFKSFLVNQDGVHRLGKKYFPAFRISKELNLDETLKYYESHSVSLKIDELNKWREGCFKLYDDIWEKTEKIRSDPNDQQTKFLKFFKEFYSSKSNQFNSCQKKIRTASINDDPRRFWFFTFIQTFTNLEKNGFYYNCSEKAWFYNPKVDETHYFNDQKLELEKCRAANFEKSFDLSINALSLMKNQINKSFRFIEYDTQRGGSHQKLYSWVPESGKFKICKSQKDPNKENQFDIFPQDVVWQNFEPDNDKTIE